METRKLKRYCEMYPFLVSIVDSGTVFPAQSSLRVDSKHMLRQGIAERINHVSVLPWTVLDPSEKTIKTKHPTPVGLIGGKLVYYIASLAQGETDYYILRDIALNEDLMERTIGEALEYTRQLRPNETLLGVVRVSYAYIGEWGRTSLGINVFLHPEAAF